MPLPAVAERSAFASDYSLQMAIAVYLHPLWKTWLSRVPARHMHLPHMLEVQCSLPNTDKNKNKKKGSVN